MEQWVVIAMACFLPMAGVELPPPLTHDEPCITGTFEMESDNGINDVCPIGTIMLLTLLSAAEEILPGHPYTFYIGCGKHGDMEEMA